ncbi:hypothetical protein LINPERPRIM_LOCUS27828, partial [Linum perenne]
EKLPVTFYWNRAAGLNHTAFSRYLGKIVRNNQVCPVRIKKWSDLTDAQKDHMWAAAKVNMFCDMPFQVLTILNKKNGGPSYIVDY